METQKKILIVDDIELNRAILGELFRETYEVLEAENGLEAIRAMEQHDEAIAVVLLDIIMPVMDGFGVLQEMAAHGWAGRIPVVMITSETSAGVMQKGYEMGAADVISKPFSPDIIRQRIHNIVEQYTYKLHLEKLVEQQTDALRSQARKLRDNSTQMIDILSAVIEFKNTESVGHIHNIRTLTRMLLGELAVRHEEYGLSEELMETISEAAAMHDIGKVAIPDHILNKPGKLTPEEFEIMKTHSVRGCEILERLSSVQYLDYYDYCYTICRHHHERWDGRGYPDGLIGNQTPIWAQVVSLADVYDALTSKRVYKEAYSDQQAIEMVLAGECGAFNPMLIECFLALAPALKDGIPKEQSAPSRPPNSKAAPFGQKGKPKQPETDVSSRTLRLLELERQKYRILSELSGEILFDYDFKTDQLVFSEKYQILTGKEPVIANLRETLCDPALIPEEDKTRLVRSLKRITAAHPACKLELRVNLDGNGLAWHEAYLYPIWDTDAEGGRIGYMGKLINIEKRKRENRQLQRAADRDPLTGLLNRNALHRQVARGLMPENAAGAALCFIDIDNFKMVNDTFGHSFGDIILKHVASILNACTRKTDLVARIGGDEFAVFFQGVSDESVLARKLATICESLCKNFEGCDLSGSVGAARFPQDGRDFDSLLLRADQALYQSKRHGKNQYQIYCKGDGEHSFQSLQSGMDH